LPDNKYTPSITLTYNNTSYSAIFTANIVKAATDGVSPIIWKLLPSSTQIIFAASEESDVRTLRLQMERVEGNSHETLSVEDSGL